MWIVEQYEDFLYLLNIYHELHNDIKRLRLEFTNRVPRHDTQSQRNDFRGHHVFQTGLSYLHLPANGRCFLPSAINNSLCLWPSFLLWWNYLGERIYKKRAFRKCTITDHGYPKSFYCSWIENRITWWKYCVWRIRKLCLAYKLVNCYSMLAIIL